MKTRRLPSSPLIIVSSDSINPDLNGGNLVVSCCKCQVHFLTGAINEACFGFIFLQVPSMKLALGIKVMAVLSAEL
jgi:hypothetical protein